MTSCACDPRTHLREIAVYANADDRPVLWMVACDSCDPGIDAAKKRQAASEDAKSRRGRPPQTLSGFRAQLDRECQAGSGVRWRVDPGWIERRPLREHDQLRAEEQERREGRAAK